jgi:CHASE2 domain-containing sensor protein
MPVGDPWVNASYDYLFRFGARGVSNKCVLVLMDGAASQAQDQVIGNWDRALHAQFLTNLWMGGSPLVVFDVFLRRAKGPSDQALAEAIRAHGHVVLAGGVVAPETPKAEILEGSAPYELFLGAASDWGVAQVEDNPSRTVRRHLPFAGSGSNHLQSLPWAAARPAGAKLADTPGTMAALLRRRQKRSLGNIELPHRLFQLPKLFSRQDSLYWKKTPNF